MIGTKSIKTKKYDVRDEDFCLVRELSLLM